LLEVCILYPFLRDSLFSLNLALIVKQTVIQRGLIIWQTEVKN
jgi:hypothetical protein